MAPQAYLGNGVYVKGDRGSLALTTEDGVRVTNTICLDRDVYRALAKYVDRYVTHGHTTAERESA